MPAPDHPLFTADELTHWLGELVGDVVVETDHAVMLERVVWGWLKPVLKLAERPDPLPDEVFAWAIELAAIAHQNPAGLNSAQLGDRQQNFSAERRTAILAEAAATGSPAPKPRGRFGKAKPYPDPAC